MREIKFRGKRINDHDVNCGEWVYGWMHKQYSKSSNYTAITTHISLNDQGCIWAYEVDSETVGQYTGLKDKNGKEIYEGHILRIEYMKLALGSNLGVTEVEAELTGVVELKNMSLTITNIIGEKWSEYTGYQHKEGDCRWIELHDVYENSCDAEWQVEVIGNIHENPELL